MIVRHVYDKAFMARFCDRYEQKHKFQPNKKVVLETRTVSRQRHLVRGVWLQYKAEAYLLPWVTPQYS